jgi:hypothetical protein
VQLGIARTGIESVHDVKVNVVSDPVMLVALVCWLTSTSNFVSLHVRVPTPVRVNVAGVDEVFVIVVEPENGMLPGSSRRCVEAEADAAPTASTPTAAIAVSRTNFRMDMVFLLVALSVR